MEHPDIKGSCLCGEVTYAVRKPFSTFQYCHCSRCRKMSGSAHACNIIVPPEQFNWLTGEENIGRFNPTDTKHFATAFCKNCGSTLPWMAKTGTAAIVPAGTLDDDPQQQPAINIFWDSRAPWYTFVNQLDTYATLPGKSDMCRLDESS